MTTPLRQSPGTLGNASAWLRSVWMIGCLMGPADVFGGPGPDAIEQASRRLQSEWSEVFYLAPRQTKTARYQDLLTRTQSLKGKNPDRAEPLIVEAIILCTYSASALGLDTLELLETSRDLLQKAIAMDPLALEGAAYVTLGNLYRRLPGWPLLYGDKKRARALFESGVRRYPEGIDTNFFYGDFLLEEGERLKAIPYLEQAERAPIRPTLRVSDTRLKEELKTILKDARNGTTTRSDFFGLFTPSFK